MIIGITGGTGCGKTTLLNQIEARGGLVLDCDAIYHRLLQTDETLLARIGEAFPGTVGKEGLDRKKLGAQVFADPQALKRLNTITHAAVKAQVREQLAGFTGLGAIDAIALFESGLDELCDITVAVTAPEEQRLCRLMKREKISEDYALARIRAQKGEDYFIRVCDCILRNDGTLEQFQRKCRAFLDGLPGQK